MALKWQLIVVNKIRDWSVFLSMYIYVWQGGGSCPPVLMYKLMYISCLLTVTHQYVTYWKYKQWDVHWCCTRAIKSLHPLQFSFKRTCISLICRHIDCLQVVSDVQSDVQIWCQLRVLSGWCLLLYKTCPNVSHLMWGSIMSPTGFHLVFVPNQMLVLWGLPNQSHNALKITGLAFVFRIWTFQPSIWWKRIMWMIVPL